MNATAIQRIEAAGYKLRLAGDAIQVSPADRLTAEQRAFIRANKAALVAALAARVSTEGELVAVPDLVCCFDCRHSVLPPDTCPRNGWRRCGLDLPNGGGFSQALRRCEQWESAL